MARLASLVRPSRFFTRSSAKSSENNNNSTTTTSSRRSSSHYTSTDGFLGESRSSLALPAPPQTPKQQRQGSGSEAVVASGRKRSASLTKLREKFARDRGGGEVPESVQEVRESVLLLPTGDHEALSGGVEESDRRSARSGSETLALGRSPGEEALGGEKETETGTEVSELKLDGLEEEVNQNQRSTYDCPPAVVVEEPTPGGEEGDAVEGDADRDGDGDTPAVTSEGIFTPPTPTPAQHGQHTKLVPSGGGSSETTIAGNSNESRSNSSVSNVSPRHRPSDANPLTANNTPTPIDLTTTSPSPTARPFTPSPPAPKTMSRKLWVRRPGASATLIPISPADLVDDVRENILKKYRNSLGTTFDAPDMSLRILQRGSHSNGAQGQVMERVLGPEEEMARVLEETYPGGQRVEEAVVIDTPVRERRTPRPSPGFVVRGGGGGYTHGYGQGEYADAYRPPENGGEYFPPMPAAAAAGVVPPGLPPTADGGRVAHPNQIPLEPPHQQGHQRSISVLNTGHIPPLPSPGGTLRAERQMRLAHMPGPSTLQHNQHSSHRNGATADGGRPKYARQHTSSPTIVQHPSHTSQHVQHQAGLPMPNGSTTMETGVPASLNVNPLHPLVHMGRSATTRPREGSLAGSSDAAAEGSGIGGGGVRSAVPTVPEHDHPPTPPAAVIEGLSAVQGGSTPPTPGSGISLRAGAAARPRKGRRGTPTTGTGLGGGEKMGAVRGGRHPLDSEQGGNKAGVWNAGSGMKGSAQGMNPTAQNGNAGATTSLASSVLDGSVPPINVLIVEDNIINLRILEGLMKRLRVRWQTAMNGRIAVDMWRRGGFHLVLMDIQMPVMNGLQATKEIRRLERTNGIGVFSAEEELSPGVEDVVGKIKKLGDVEEVDTHGEQDGSLAAKRESKPSNSKEDDRLSLSEGLFKSPVIIVALTASSLQSDRHEALAAGCNDFLTKPVNFVWLERKVKEWGCMQALIDFDGWRKWKEFAAREEEGKTDEQREAERVKAEKEKRRMEKMAILQEKQRVKKETEEAEKEKERRRKRASAQSSEVINGGEHFAGNGVGVGEG